VCEVKIRQPKGKNMRSAFLKRTLLAVFCAGAFSWNSQAQFTPVDIGAPNGPGSITTNAEPGSYTVVGGGNEFWAEQDQGFFAYYEQTGDFDINVRTESFTPANRWAKAGLMIRENLNRDSIMVFNAVNPANVPVQDPLGEVGANQRELLWRSGNPADTENGGSNGGRHAIGNPPSSFPNAWLRLTRQGNVVNAYIGTDGANWQLVRSFNTGQNSGATDFIRPFPATSLIGLALSSHNDDVSRVGQGNPPYSLTATAEFRGFGQTTPSIAGQPAATTVSVGQTANFTVTLGNGHASFAAYQWREDGLDIPGATAASYSKTGPQLSDNGKVYSVLVSNQLNGTTVVSSGATLTVIDAPQVVGISSRNDPTGVYVTYSRAMGVSAVNTANYSITNAGGSLTISSASFVGSGDTVVRLAVPMMSLGSTFTVTVSGVSDANGGVLTPNPSSGSFTYGQGINARAGLTMRRFDGIGGTDLNSMLNLQNLAATCANPARNDPNIATFEYGTNPQYNSTDGNTENFGAWLYGQFVPPVSGNYRFGLSSDDYSRLYLSTDSSPANRVLVMEQPGWNGGREFAGRITGNIYLEAGRTYYMEGFIKEGGGGDHITVAVQKPGDPAIVNGQTGIPRSMFATNYSIGCPPNTFFNTLGPVFVTAPPANQTVNENATAQFTVRVDGTPPYSVQWFSNGVAVAGANSLTYTFAPLRFANGAQYHAVVNNEFSSATSAVATLTVNSDEIAPTLVRAHGSVTFTNATIVFSEPVDVATATEVSNYSITNSAGVPLNVLSISVRDHTNVVLHTDTQTQNEIYTVVINDVTDRAGVPNPVAPDSTIVFAGYIWVPGFALMEVYPTGGGNTIPLLTGHPSFPNYPRERYYINQANSRAAYPNDNNDNYGGRISGWFVPPASQNYQFSINNDDDALLRGSLSEYPADAQDIGSQPCCSGTFRNTGPALPLTADQRYWYALLWKEGGGGDYAALSVNGTTALSGSQIGVYLNPLGATLVITQQPMSTTKPVNGFATFRVGAELNILDGVSRNITYQWRSNGVDIVGANGPTYTTPQLALENDGDIYNVLVTVAGEMAQSDDAVLSVIDDTILPELVGVRADGSFRKIHLTWSELMTEGSAIDPGNYIIKDPSGVEVFVNDVTFGGTTVVLNLLTPLQENTTYSVDIGFQFDLAGNQTAPVGSSEIDPDGGIVTNITSWVVSRGFTFFRAYLGLSVPDYQNPQPVIDAINSGRAPDFSFYTNVVNWPQSVPDINNYGMNFRGLFRAPATGTYKFEPAHDDSGNLLFSTDADPNNATVVMDFDCCTGFGAGEAGYSVDLVEGNLYFFDLRVVEAGGGDYAGLAVTLPDGRYFAPIPAAFLAVAVDQTTAVDNPGIAQQPQSQQIVENQMATFSVAATNSGPNPITYQWQVDDGSGFTDIQGATGTSYTTPLRTLANDGDVYRVLVYAPGVTLASDPATLTVINDTFKPTVLAARGVRALDAIRIVFDEPVSAGTATEASNYSLTDTNGTPIVLGTPVLEADQRTVRIPTDPQVAGGYYVVSVQNVMDLVGNMMDGTNLTFQTFIWSRGFAWVEYYMSITGGTLADLTNNAKYPNMPDISNYVTLLETRTDWADNYGSRISGLLLPPQTGNYKFYISSDDQGAFFLSTDATPANKVQIATEPAWNGSREWINGSNQGSRGTPPANISADVALAASEARYFEALNKEGGGGDKLGVTWKLPTGPDVVNGTLPIHGTHMATLADPVGASITVTQQPISTNVIAGQTATLRVAAVGTNANGTAPVVYQWQRSTITGWEDILGANGTTFTTPAIAAGDVRIYRALIFIPGAFTISDVATVSGPGVLTISRSGGNVTVAWSGNGVLQWADDVTGTWTDVPGAMNPFIMDASTAARKFFRLR
jgi:hypothetical protein